MDRVGGPKDSKGLDVGVRGLLSGDLRFGIYELDESLATANAKL